jgi:signal transduction histidine kinase
MVDNAVRHGAGTITLTAAALREPVAWGCVIAVHDEGPGMPSAFLAQAAERFRRAEASRTSPGNGLGLALVDAIAIAHHGQLRICSGGAHHRQSSPEAKWSAVVCDHPSDGATTSLLLPAGSSFGSDRAPS